MSILNDSNLPQNTFMQHSSITESELNDSYMSDPVEHNHVIHDYNPIRKDVHNNKKIIPLHTTNQNVPYNTIGTIRSKITTNVNSVVQNIMDLELYEGVLISSIVCILISLLIALIKN